MYRTNEKSKDTEAVEQTSPLLEFETITRFSKTTYQAESEKAFFFQHMAERWSVPWFSRSPFSNGIRVVNRNARDRDKAYTVAMYRFWDVKAEAYRYVEEYYDVIPEGVFLDSYGLFRKELDIDDARLWFARTGIKNPPTNIIVI